MKQRTKLFFAGLLMAGLVFLGIATQVSAQNEGDTFGLKPVDNALTLGGGDIREIAARFINIALGLLGIITVGLILYGGFLYMTAGGNEDRVAEGKKYIVNAVIGLVIIFSAWAIVQFVFNQLNSAINGGSDVASDNGSSDLPDPGSCEGDNYNADDCDRFCQDNPGASICQEREFYVKAITPGSDSENQILTGMKNVTVRVLFSRPLSDENDISKAASLVINNNPLPIKISLVEGNRVLEINYVENGVATPFRVNSGNYITVTVNPDLKDTSGKSLKTKYSVGEVTYGNTGYFTVDEDINDATKPAVEQISLNGLSGTDLNFPLNSNFTISAIINDRKNVSYGGNGLVKIVISEVGGNTILTGYSAPTGQEGSSQPFTVDYSTKLSGKFKAGQNYLVTLTAFDIDGNVQTSSVNFRVVATHCDNDIQDGDETGPDSGGSCGGGDGDQCSEDSDCSSGYQCVDNKCSPAPAITNLDPGNGAPGNWITIAGKNFGTKQGKVYFGVDRNDDGKFTTDNEWVEATVVNCGTGASWSPYWVVVAVPGPSADFSTGVETPIKIVTADNKTDTTINDFGPKPNTDGLFVINTTQRPGLCKVGVTTDTEVTLGGQKVTLPAGNEAGLPDVPVTAKGSGFGTKGDTDRLVFGANKNPITGALSGGFPAETSGNNWTDLAINSRVPSNLKAGNYAVHVSAGGQSSNGVKFNILSADKAQIVPSISSIDPTSTTKLSLVTINGRGFGNETGQVWLFPAGRPLNPTTACLGSIPDPDCKLLNIDSLPTQCGDTWGDTQIIGQIPGSFNGSKAVVIIKNSSGFTSSAQDSIEVVNGEPRPGICRLAPNAGPAPLPSGSSGLTIYGLNFVTTNPTLYFWQSGADPNNYATWLDSTRDRFDGLNVIKDITSSKIVTTLPVSNQSGRSMSTGPIKFKSFGTNLLSNGVTYTVDSCVNSKSPLPGFHCCPSGPDAGQWKANSQSCQGEARDSAYLWRFTTGILTYPPKVVEECKADGSVFPSPTPRSQGTGLAVNSTACVNSSIAVRFSEDMDEATINNNTIKVFACGTKDGQIDCAAKKDPVTTGLSYQSAGKTLIIKQAPPTLAANTWYQVEIGSGLTSKKATKFLGVDTTVSAPIVATRPCGNGTAYCFTFKTNSAECVLTDAGINPAEYTTRQLGIIQDPRFPFNSADLYLPTQNPPEKIPPFPNYFYIWGKGNQDCSVLNVDQYPWVWAPGITGTDSDKASAFKSVKAATTTTLPYLNSRGIVAARAHTAPDTVTIKAEATISNVNNGNPSAGGSSLDTIGGTDVLATSDIIVPATGYVSPMGKAYNTAGSSLVSLQSSFTLQFKYSKSPSLTNTNLLERRNITQPRIGYKVNVIGTVVCFTTYRAVTLDLQHCFTPSLSNSGIYNIALTWDQNSKKLTWIDLNNLSNKAETNLPAGVPLATDNAAAMVTTKVPASDPGPTYFAIRLRNDVIDLTVKSSSKFTPTSKLTIDLADPEVTYYEPNCVESCVNTSLRADFNRQMDTATFADGFKIYKCNDGVACAQADEISQYAIDEQTSTAISLRANLKPGSVLDKNTYYKVSLNGTGSSIKALLGANPKKLGKALPKTEWIFKTKNDGTPCKVSSLVVTPVSFSATEIGQRDQFTVTPYSAPNACSKVGQALNKWDYQYNWSVASLAVAKISKIKPASFSNIPSFCTNSCLKKGSTITAATGAADLPICGNGKIDAGEDCDIAATGEKPGVSCSLTCLRPGNTNAFNDQNNGANVCGNGTVEAEVGEQCDPGNKDGKVKTDDPICSSKCLLKGSTTGNTTVGVANCGDSFVTAGQELCDPNDPATKAGCTNQCLHAGTKVASFWCKDNQANFGTNPACLNSVSVCGNGIIEQAEDCEISGPNASGAGVCSSQCLFIDACGLPADKRPCQAGDLGCTNKCTLQGSKTSYSTPSICGDTTIGIGENKSCELPSGDSSNTAGPTQLVEAVGQGSLVAGQTYQQTDIHVNTVTENKTVSSTADYRLQCGYQEFDQPISLSKIDADVEGNAYNDCPNNYDNSKGVDGQSCCQLRPKRVAESPADGAGFFSAGVCRNTNIEVEFSKELNSDTISQNMFLVRGFTESNFDCTADPVNGQDFTSYVKKTVAGETPDLGFWARLWQRIVAWFHDLLGNSATATTVTDLSEFKNIKTWCSVGMPVTTESHTITKPDSTKATVASLAISQALEPTTVYGVLLRGDRGGITDVRGVPLGSKPDSENNSRNDSWFFKTGAKICKLSGVVVDPTSYLFKKPNTSATFTALGFTDDAGTTGKIVPVAGYRWDWAWLPQNNPVFDFAPQTPTNKLNVTAKNVAGEVTGVAQAIVTEDASTENNQKGKIFSGTFQLTAFFCERPWPSEANFPYKDTEYNFSTGYCADSGKAGDASDDLPLLKDALSLGGVPGSTDTLRKLVFFNDKNEDAIGIQVFSSEEPLVEWYEKKFGTTGSMQATTVGGYRALTDNNNYYVQALNLAPGASSSPTDDKVYSNIYLFSINPNASDESRAVFKKFIDNLQFNINVTNHGYCLKPGGNIRTNPNLFSATQCTTDFNCRDAEGVALAGTSGVCSNARTKFQRDWKRLADVRTAQENIDEYFAANKDKFDFKGDLAGGSFAPGYTVSRWGQSWGTLQTLVGGLPTDPLNQWTNCQADDKQTCWNAGNTTYYCPKYASVYEYEYVPSTRSYIFHAPLEFFTVNDQVTKDQVNVANFSSSRWAGCASGAYNPFSEKCGDGVLNANEQCEPPGTIEQVTEIQNATTFKCASWASSKSCTTAAQCGQYSQNFATGSPAAKVHVADGKQGVCAVNRGSAILLPYRTMPRQGNDEFELVSCSSNANCQVDRNYDAGNNLTNLGLASYDPAAKTLAKAPSGLGDFANYYNSEKPNFYCNETLTKTATFTSDTCVPSGYGTVQCPANQIVTRTCTNSCTWQYGSCGSAGSCGNGIVEGGESCDDGALNGTYGHCNAPTDGAPGCTGLAAAGYCGNGKLDKDSTGKALEFCDPSVPGSLFTANYNAAQAKSCAWDCQEYGAYCGDGLTQTDKGEECDDGNTKDDAKCMANCKLPAISCLKAVEAKSTIENGVTNFTLPISGGFLSESSCNAATPRSLCAAANLTCKEVKIGSTVLGCDSNYSKLGVSSKISDFVLAVLAPDVVSCNGIYVPGGVNNLPPDTAAAQCGNGVLEKELGEECDAGKNNDVKCVPVTGEKYCSYCGKGCKILTTDNLVYCGNGTLDPGEKCETKSDGSIIALSGSGNTSDCGVGLQECLLTCNGNADCNAACNKKYSNCTPSTFVASCSEFGSYSCSSCKTVIPQCLQCGFFEKGALPQVRVINPLVPATQSFGDLYDDSYTISLFRGLDANQTGTNAQKQALSSGLTKYANNNTALNLRRMVNGVTGDIDDYIQTNNQCTNKYTVVFNAAKVVKNGSTASTIKGSDLNGSTFVFPVNGQADKIEQQIFYSPAVPPSTFRVVMSWTDTNAKFNGLVYNDETPSTGSTAVKEDSLIDYLTAATAQTLIPNLQTVVDMINNDSTYQEHPCVDVYGQPRSEADNGGSICSDEEIKDGLEAWMNEVNKFVPPTIDACNNMSQIAGYWAPNALGFRTFANKLPYSSKARYLCREVNGVKISEQVNSKTVQTIAFTIKPPTNSTKPFAFLVGEYGSSGLPAQRNGDLQVRVYEYRDGQVPLYSIYGPTYTFSIKNTGSSTSNPSAAQYWHAFNLVKEGNVYVVKKVPQTNSSGTVTGEYADGMLQSTFCSTLNHIPGESCSQ